MSHHQHTNDPHYDVDCHHFAPAALSAPVAAGLTPFPPPHRSGLAPFPAAPNGARVLGECAHSRAYRQTHTLTRIQPASPRRPDTHSRQIRTHVHRDKRTRTHTQAQAHVHAHTQYAQASARAHTHKRTHIRTHAHAHSHTHSRVMQNPARPTHTARTRPCTPPGHVHTHTNTRARALFCFNCVCVCVCVFVNAVGARTRAGRLCGRVA